MTDTLAGGDGRLDPAKPDRARAFGDDVDIDQMTPSRFTVSSDLDELVTHALEDLRPELSRSVGSSDFVAAGENFGSRSSRKHSPLSLVDAGVSAVVA